MQKGKKQNEGQSNILVAIRIRPLNQKEVSNGEYDVIRVQESLIVVLDPIELEFESENKKMLEVYHRSKEQRYAFDKIYKDHSSEEIYQETVQPLIRTVLNGYNATVFAYGPTGTGKTHTMLGNQEVYGLNVLAINNIFDQIRKDHDYDYRVIITYVEIYNEMIRDLLIPSSGYLELRDDPQKGIVITGVTQFKAQSTEQVMNLLLLGNKRRTTEATNANQTSSRSHAVFQITCLKVSKTKNTNVQTMIGKLSLIDLAGSERGTVTENRGIRLMEGAKINRSLLALANCINALGDKNKKGFFVPYRDSKLTRLLKDSLGGNCKTVMIATVSPAGSQFQQTINTLKYANRAKNIKTKQTSNKKLVSLHISEYKNIINDLRQQIQQLKLKLHQKSDSDNPFQNEYQRKPSQKRKTEQQQNCSCGRGQQQEQLKKIEAQIFQNFNQRIQLRRALMQLEQQNALNILQIKRRQGQIILLKKSQGDVSEQQRRQQIEQHQKAVSTLKMSTVKNNIKKQLMNVNLMESMTGTKKIRDSIIKRIKFQNNRQFLEMVIKNHVFQLQNIELQINLQIQQKIIGDLKNIVVAQKQTLKQNGIEAMKIDDQFDDDEVELQIEGEGEAQDYNQEDISQDQDDDLEQYKLVQKQSKDRMNMHFGDKNKKAIPNSVKKSLSADKNSDQQDNPKKSTKPIINPNSKVFPNNSDFGIVGQTALKSLNKKQPNNAFANSQAPKVQRQRTVQKNLPLDFNLKGKNILQVNKDKKKAK